MMHDRRCHYCGSPLPEIRLGARLPIMKARLFDLIQRSGADGILVEDLRAILGVNERCLKSHVHQLNEMIAGSGYHLYTRAKAVFLVNGPPPRKRWWRNRSVAGRPA
jgi:hypothetical protein